MDSASILDILKTLRAWSKNFHTTSVISLLQPAPELLPLFDQVLVLREGRLVFQGAATAVSNYFEFDLCFSRQEDVGATDFVIACLTIPSTQDNKSIKSRHRASSPSSQLLSTTVPALQPLSPTSTDEFVSAFLTSSYGRALAMSLSSSSPLPTPSSHILSSWTKHERCPFSICGSFSSFLLLLHRDALLTCRDTALLCTRLLRSIVLGVITGFLYFQIGMNAFPSTIFGALYQTILTIAFQSTAALPSYFNARPLFYKQREAGFFTCFPALLASTLVGFPLVVIDSLLFGSFVYFCTGFYEGAGGREGGGQDIWESSEHFGIFLLNLMAIGWAMMAFFRGTAFLCPSLTVVGAMAGIFVFSFLLFSGFIIPRTAMPHSFAWIMWIDPIFYCYQGWPSSSLSPFLPLSSPCLFPGLFLLPKSIKCDSTSCPVFLFFQQQPSQPTSSSAVPDTRPLFPSPSLHQRWGMLFCSSEGFSFLLLGDGKAL